MRDKSWINKKKFRIKEFSIAQVLIGDLSIRRKNIVIYI